MCGVDGCREVFRAFSAFNSHVYRHHRSVIGLGTGSTEPQQPALLTCESSDQAPGPSFQEGYAYDIPEEFVGLQDLTEDSDQDDLRSTLQRAADSREHLQTVTAAKFLLQLREGRQISQVAISDVTTGCKTLCKQTADEIKEGVKATLASAGISCGSIPRLTNVLDTEPDPFRNIDSSYRFEKFCVEHLGCLVSWCIAKPKILI